MVSLLLLFVPKSADDLVRRVVDWRKREPVLHVKIQGKAGVVPFTSDLWVDRDKYKCSYNCKIGTFDYVMVQNKAQSVEIERLSQRYDRHPASAMAYGWLLGNSHIFSYAPLTSPSVLFANYEKLFTKPTRTKSSRGDRLEWTVVSEQGEGHFAADIDGDGRILFFSEAIGGRVREWTFSYLPTPSSFPDSKLELIVPDGFAPQTLPDAGIPLEADSKFPVEGWVDAKSGAAVSIKARLGGKTGIVAVLDDGDISRAVVPSLKRLFDQKIPIIIVGAKGSRTGPGWLSDPRGTLLEKLNPPATPMFYFVEPNGNLKVMMLGFDRKNASAFESEALRHISEKE